MMGCVPGHLAGSRVLSTVVHQAVSHPSLPVHFNVKVSNLFFYSLGFGDFMKEKSSLLSPRVSPRFFWPTPPSSKFSSVNGGEQSQSPCPSRGWGALTDGAALTLAHRVPVATHPSHKTRHKCPTTDACSTCCLHARTIRTLSVTLFLPQGAGLCFGQKGTHLPSGLWLPPGRPGEKSALRCGPKSRVHSSGSVPAGLPLAGVSLEGHTLSRLWAPYSPPPASSSAAFTRGAGSGSGSAGLYHFIYIPPGSLPAHTSGNHMGPGPSPGCHDVSDGQTEGHPSSPRAPEAHQLG